MTNIKLNSSSLRGKTIFFNIELILKASTLILKTAKATQAKTTRNDFKHF